jgi:hypothetical protein
VRTSLRSRAITVSALHVDITWCADGGDARQSSLSRWVRHAPQPLTSASSQPHFARRQQRSSGHNRHHPHRAHEEHPPAAERTHNERTHSRRGELTRAHPPRGSGTDGVPNRSHCFDALVHGCQRPGRGKISAIHRECDKYNGWLEAFRKSFSATNRELSHSLCMAEIHPPTFTNG